MYMIEKTFKGIELGHRVRNQKLLNFGEIKSPNKCRNLHGHSASIKVGLTSDVLVNDMIIDFNDLSFIKDMISNYLDHHTILSMNDDLLFIFMTYFTLPFIEKNENENENKKEITIKSISNFLSLIDNNQFKCFKFSENIMDNIPIDFIPNFNVLNEFISSFVFINTEPTAENMSKLIYDYVDGYLRKINSDHGLSIKCSYVEFNETENGKAIYRGV